MADLAQLSDADLSALAAGDLTQVSDAGLAHLSGAASSPVPAPVKIGRDAFPDTLKQVLSDTDWGTRNIAAAGTALSNLYYGARQLAGQAYDAIRPTTPNELVTDKKTTVDDSANIQANRIIAHSAPIGSILGNVALLAPTTLIPGANTVAGAGAISALTGALQPTQGDESRLLNTAVSTIGGMGGQWLGNKLGTAFQNYINGKSAAAAAEASRNAPQDAALAAAQDAGYTIPRSLYNPSFMTNRLESIGGKAAIKQQAALENQQTTNALARKAIGLPDDAPLDANTLDAAKRAAYVPYQDVSGLPRVAPTGVSSGNPAADLEALKQARSDARGWFNSYNRSANPDELAKARAFQATADRLENNLEGYAAQAGRPDLVDNLRAARTQLAKIYTVERAMNNGDISAPVIGRLAAKGSPLSDGLDTIGNTQNAFRQVMQAGASVPAAGVSKSEALAGAALATVGHALGGGPGLAAGLLPLLSHPARALALSKFLQSAPDYGIGMGNDLAGALLTPKSGALLSRGLTQWGALNAANPQD